MYYNKLLFFLPIGSNGCPMPPSCIPAFDEMTGCTNQCPVVCGPEQIYCDSLVTGPGNFSVGCPVVGGYCLSKYWPDGCPAQCSVDSCDQG